MTPRAPMEAPPLRLQAMEALWPVEAAAFNLFPPPTSMLPASQSRPVLVLPGFTAGDLSTLPLRQLLRGQGHWVHAWRLGRNLGPTHRAVQGMRALLHQLADRHSSPITLIGWSLGGVYARALASERPELVSQVITLGSPFRVGDGDRSAAQPLWERVRHLHTQDLIAGDVAEEARAALTVPATSIFTKTDGVVRWQLCVDDVGPLAGNRRAENIEVYGTHSGLGVNTSAAFAVLDRLARPVDAWQPFQAPRLLEPWYPQSTVKSERARAG